MLGLFAMATVAACLAASCGGGGDRVGPATPRDVAFEVLVQSGSRSAGPTCGNFVVRTQAEWLDLASRLDVPPDTVQVDFTHSTLLVFSEICNGCNSYDLQVGRIRDVGARWVVDATQKSCSLDCDAEFGAFAIVRVEATTDEVDFAVAHLPGDRC